MKKKRTCTMLAHTTRPACMDQSTVVCTNCGESTGGNDQDLEKQQAQDGFEVCLFHTNSYIEGSDMKTVEHENSTF